MKVLPPHYMFKAIGGNYRESLDRSSRWIIGLIEKNVKPIIARGIVYVWRIDHRGSVEYTVIVVV